MASNIKLFSDPAQLKFISAEVVLNNKTPFLVGQPVNIESTAGTSLYGINHPGDQSTTKFARFKQLVSGNKVFTLPTAVNAPQTTTGGALSAANQLRAVVTVDDVPTLRARSDQVAAAGGSLVGAAGGGTAVGDATISIKGTTAAALLVGSTQLSLASSGALTTTVIVGDKITVAGDSQVYTVTETSQAFNGTTEVLVDVTPPLVVAKVAAQAVTIAAGSDRTVLLGTAPAVGAIVDVLVMDSADVITETGGAMTAGRQYATDCKSFYHTAGTVNLTKLM